MPTLTVNGTELYHEVRGDGPPLLCIMGASGDAGHFETLAQLLADEFTVITYDRRGNGRSPRPAEWTTTSPQEQADDAAALLDALGLSPAAVFGTSSGGTFALRMLVRHPHAVRGALLHEAVLARLYDDPEAVATAGRELVRAGMEVGGPREALKRFFVRVGGQANWDALDANLRERMLQTAGTFINVELGTFEAYLPADEELAAITAPIQILVSEHGRPPLHGAARRLAERLGVAVTRIPGTHTAYLDHPRELAEAIRPFLRQLTSVAALAARTVSRDRGTDRISLRNACNTRLSSPQAERRRPEGSRAQIPRSCCAMRSSNGCCACRGVRSRF